MKQPTMRSAPDVGSGLQWKDRTLGEFVCNLNLFKLRVTKRQRNKFTYRLVSTYMPIIIITYAILIKQVDIPSLIQKIMKSFKIELLSKAEVVTVFQL